MQSSVLVPEEGVTISAPAYQPKGWYDVSAPTTVLSALTKHGVYPDVRFALNAYRVPDASDEFNAKHDLAKFSHLPDKRNPWSDPWWFRKEFTLPALPAGQRVWL
ncbi:MAG: glycoside hydrolase family 2, partial [Kiritimatiellaeota bacterium]|nr:glycoside hydrolase family 2 [Kiritimatiellota bacterium]